MPLVYRVRRWGLLLLLAVLLGAGAACTAQDGDVPHPTEAVGVEARVADAVLATRVRKALLDTLSLRAFDFEVTARNGQVALRGTVGTDAEQSLAEALARQVAGVHGLTSHLVVSDSSARARR